MKFWTEAKLGKTVRWHSVMYMAAKISSMNLFRLSRNYPGKEMFISSVSSALMAQLQYFLFTDIDLCIIIAIVYYNVRKSHFFIYRILPDIKQSAATHPRTAAKGPFSDEVEKISIRRIFHPILFGLPHQVVYLDNFFLLIVVYF